ncbi:ROK family protein [Hansschlegelia zhihuaiae]|uniref:ROK family protein n=1 Tax=Hansschlegelia zhihuaiae TaxID=405005 RepID=A0A4Q0MC87_9HYPH|nr:ROK family protein [Hansschlegelia zhihuaiae]RXF70805.1 ROK family protein [Hansschlegelia zhihuaiae]
MLIGVDFGGTKIEAAGLGLGGETLARERVVTPRGEYQASVEAVARLVAGIERTLGPARGVGVGIPGSLSPADGLVRNANSTWLNGRPFGRDLASALGREVRVENDANCLAVSEAVDGAAAGARMAFAVILGTGCGAGIAIDGRAHGGRGGLAGEFGHNTLPWPDGEDETPGPACWCGRRGCLETYLSGSGLSDRHFEATEERLDATTIAAAAAAGEPRAVHTLAQHRDRLARALASVVNLIDPDVIVLGGGVSNIASLYPGLTEDVRAYVFSGACDTPVRPAAHGASSGVRGAAWLWKDD